MKKAIVLDNLCAVIDNSISPDVPNLTLMLPGSPVMFNISNVQDLAALKEFIEEMLYAADFQG